jgi:hypothetical protein
MTALEKMLRLRQELDEVIADLQSSGGSEQAAAPRFMKVPDFAHSRGLSDRTIRDYCDLGMPHEGQGKGRRVLVAEAIAWIQAGGPKAARGARKGRAA